MSDSLILQHREGAVMRLVLNNPATGNAISLAMARALMESALLCEEDDGIRCVLLTGQGRLFCAGGDIGEFAAAGDGVPSLIKEITGCLHLALSRLARMGKPLVTAVQGPAAGAGMSLAALGDVALAASSAHFTPAYSAIGLTPDGGSTWLLPRLIGLRRAQELFLLNQRLTAAEAARIGLITRVVDDAALAAEATATATQLSQMPAASTGRTRQLLLTSFANPPEAQMEAETRAIADASRSPESRDLVAAFMARRKTK